MAITAEELRILIRAETKAATENLNRFRKTSKNTTIDLKAMARQLIGPLSVTAGLIALGRVASNAIKGAIRYAASVEQISVAFEVLLGSAQAAEEVLEDLRQFSIKTPFTFQELGPAARRLIQVGIAAEDVVDVMRDLGNAASGNRETLDRLIGAYTQLKNKGKASLEEINRFSEAGVPIMQQLAENLDMSTQALFKFVSAGKVGFEDVNKALQDLTRGEGKLAGQLEAQSTTLIGVMSTATGAVQELGRAFTEDLLPFLTKSVNKFIVLTEAIMAQRDANKSLGAALKSIKGLEGLEGAELSAEALRLLGLARVEAAKLAEDIKTDPTGILAGVLRVLNQEIAELEAIIGRVGAAFGGGGDEDGLGAGIPEVTADMALLTEEFARLGKIQKANAEAFANTTGEQIRAKEELIAYLETFQQIGRVIPILANLRGELQTLKNVTSESFGDFPSTAPAKGFSIFKNIPARAAEAGKEAAIGFHTVFTETVSTLGKVAPFSLFENIPDLTPLQQQLRDAEIEAAKLQDTMGELFESMLTGAAQEALKGIQAIGKAMTDTSEGAKSVGDAITDMIVSLLKMLPILFLEAGLRILINNPKDPTGWAFVAASALTGLFSGLIEGAVRGNDTASSSTTNPPDPATVRSATSSFAGQTIIINNNGTIFAEDENRANIRSTAAAMASNR